MRICTAFFRPMARLLLSPGFLLSILTLMMVSPEAVSAEAQTAAPYISCPGVIHIHSRFSSGSDSLERLAEEGRNKKLGYLIITDHDLVVMEFGLPPFRNLFKKREELPSILQLGPSAYLSAFDRLNSLQHDILLIPGAQSSAYYYWTGNPLEGDLTAHDYRKEILLLGVSGADFFEHLPVLHNGAGFRISMDHLPDLLLPALALGLSLVLLFRFPWRLSAWVFFVLSFLFTLNSRPFYSSRFTPYDGPQGVAPYQDLIDYAKGKGVLTFWAHPESSYSAEGERLGPITLKDRKYTEDLKAALDYTGFAAIYGDESGAANEGREWDQILADYCSGRREQPVWVIAEADFHGTGQSEPLDTYVTVAWVPEVGRSQIIEALAKGRCYAVFQPGGKGLRLDSFEARDASGKSAWSGETLQSGQPTLSAEVSLSDGESAPVTVRVFRNGKEWTVTEGSTPLLVSRSDFLGAGEKACYRLEVQGPSSMKLLSNPIFVEHRETF